MNSREKRFHKNWFSCQKWDTYKPSVSGYLKGEIKERNAVSTSVYSPVLWPIGSRGEGGGMRDDSAEILFHIFFSRMPLWAAVLAWVGRSNLWFCPSCISSVDLGVALPLRSLERWSWRGRRGVGHARIMHVSLSWQLPEEVPVDPQGNWSCPAPSCWSYDPSRRSRKSFLRHLVSKNRIWFFFQSQRAVSMFDNRQEEWRWHAVNWLWKQKWFWNRLVGWSLWFYAVRHCNNLL